MIATDLFLLRMDLQSIRKEIDAIDRNIFEAIQQRLIAVEKVVQWKSQHNISIYDPERENIIIEEKRKLAEEYGFSPDTAEEILRCIIAESHMQEKKFLKNDDSSPRKIRHKPIHAHPDLLTIFQCLSDQSTHFFFLESLGDDEWNNQSFLGCNPIKRFAAKGKKIYINDEEQGEVENPLLWLEDQFKAYQHLVPGVRREGFSGGLVGHINFESIQYWEPSLSLESHSEFYDFEFGLFLDGLVYDRKLETLEYVFCDEDRSEYFLQLIAQKQSPIAPFVGIPCGSNFSDESFEKLIEEAKKEIVAGNVFQIVPSRKFFYDVSGSSVDFYTKLREANPSPYMFFLGFGSRQLIGSSPELIAKVQGRRIETYPIAGTRSRGKTPQEDAKLSAKMLSDEKEVAEHLMLVDMARNDLGTVCEYGSVKPEEIMALKKYSVVQHLVSRIAGKIRPDISPLKAALANFPMGTVSGSPRIEAVKCIAALEKLPRGPYAGGIGYWSVTGDLQMCLAIRSLFVHDTKAFAQAGAGIVFDSVPQYEREEVEKKSRHIRAILES